MPAIQCPNNVELPGGFANPNSLIWPIVERQSGQPRRALGNSFGEYQQYPGDPPYIHTGLDIRGLEGDYVRVVADGNIFRPANFAECAEGGATSCRLYVVAKDGRYIYYYSHLRFMNADAMSVDLRAKITNAVSTGYDIQPNTDVVVGETLCEIADFFDNRWAHLHFSIFDRLENYDGINPLLALDFERDAPAIIDDERPRIDSLDFRADRSTTAVVPAGACGEITGIVDVAARMLDSFYVTDPAPQPLPGSIDSIGLYRARTLIRHVETGNTREVPWYEFDHGPFTCTGPDRGQSCPQTMTLQDFYAASVDTPYGSALLGATYAPVLFEVASSVSDYSTIETYTHLLTNSWGQEGSWNTTLGPDGLYQVSIEASDHAGNRRARSTFVVVDNAGALDETNGRADAYVRDHAADVGATPSSLGGEPSWSSPDILVVPFGATVTLDSVAPDTRVQAGSRYDVYVRIRNDRCVALDGLRVRLTSLQPNLSVVEQDPVPITPSGQFVSDAARPNGATIAAGATVLLGPFPWTVRAPEASGVGGHRALLAEIDAPADRRAAGTAVAADNNAALRSVVVADSVAPLLSFAFGNATTATACTQLVFEADGLPMQDAATSVVLQVNSDSLLQAGWSSVPGASVVHNGSVTTVTLTRSRVALPALALPAYGVYMASVRFYQYLNGEVISGIDLH
jgi:hypothetical protein